MPSRKRKEDSPWREILDYFNSATQIGLTATPKETKYVSNLHYFGDPVYTYSLKQGIRDGFLAPYRVIRIDFDKDQGWRPPQGRSRQIRRTGRGPGLQQSRTWTGQLVSGKRTELAAEKVTEFLKGTDRYDEDHRVLRGHRTRGADAAALVNENADLSRKNRKYVMRITGDNPEGKAELDNFIHPESAYPVIVTTVPIAFHGGGCPDLQTDRARQNHPLDDGVQANHRAGHADQGRLRQDLFHDHRLQKGHRTVRRSEI